MISSAQRAYGYAKACGIVGKSFVGPRVAKLANYSQLAEFDRLLFPEPHLELPARELLFDLENRISRKIAAQIVQLLSQITVTSRVFQLLVRSYECSDLKMYLQAFAVGDKKPPEPIPIGPFSTVNFSRYPDIHAMLKGTDYEWIVDEQDITPDKMLDIQIKIDTWYYTALWDTVVHQRSRDRLYLQSLIAEEIELKNLLWALRLKIYYELEQQDIEKCLISIPYKNNNLADTAYMALSLPVDQFAAWQSFKYSSLINPEGEENWQIDPRYIQQAAALELYRKARLYFRRDPFSLTTYACFIKLKQFEENLLISMAEGLALGFSGKDILNMLGIVV